MIDLWDGLAELVSGASQGTGVLAASDIDALFESMWRNAKAEPDLLYVSTDTVWFLRRARIYTANPLPRRRLRKCFARKRQAAISKGMQRLLRRQRSEEQAMRVTHPHCRCVIDEIDEEPLDLSVDMEPLSIEAVTMRIEHEGRGEPLPFDDISSDEIAAMDFSEFDGVLRGLAEYDEASADEVMETFVNE